jgi:hypothetical protein
LSFDSVDLSSNVSMWFGIILIIVEESGSFVGNLIKVRMLFQDNDRGIFCFN